MPDFPDIIGAAGLALAFVAFVIGFNRHSEAKKNHKEAMAKQDDSAKAEDDRHKEAMAKEDNRHKEAMTALQALIHNTAPSSGPTE